MRATFLKDDRPDPAAPTEWSPEMAGLIRLFRASAPPPKPFLCHSRETLVTDPALLQRALAADIAAGPAGPRAHTGALAKDLVEYLLHARKGETKS